MSRQSMLTGTLRLAALGAVLAVPLVAYSGGHAAAEEGPAVSGAPWISLEVPANPMDRHTRDAAFVVRAYYHGNPAGYRLVGRAEGLVDGERQTIALDLEPTSATGVYAVRQQWPADGDWMVAISIADQGQPTLLAELGPNGGVSKSRYMGEMTVPVLSIGSVQVIGEKVNGDRIDAALQAMARAE